MQCSEIRRLRPRSIALELDAGEERAVREHLAVCRACRELYAAAEPALAVAWALQRESASDDASFVAGVLAGVRQRRFEHRLALRRRVRWLAAAAAAAVFAIIGTMVGLREGGGRRGLVATVERAADVEAEPAFVEVEGEDVRVYQLTAGGGEALQVAFVVDPRLEL